LIKGEFTKVQTIKASNRGSVQQALGWQYFCASKLWPDAKTIDPTGQEETPISFPPVS